MLNSKRAHIPALCARIRVRIHTSYLLNKIIFILPRTLSKSLAIVTVVHGGEGGDCDNPCCEWAAQNPCCKGLPHFRNRDVSQMRAKSRLPGSQNARTGLFWHWSVVRSFKHIYGSLFFFLTGEGKMPSVRNVQTGLFWPRKVIYANFQGI